MTAITEFTANVQKVEDDNGAITGTGIFDVLMNTATKHLQAQFDSGKINGELYANAYIQVYQVTLQTAKDIWLQKGISEAQLDLLREQITTEGVKRNHLSKQADLLSAQIITEGTQRDHLNKQIDLLDKQITSEDAKINHLNKQAELLSEQITSEGTQRNHLSKQTDLLSEQIISEGTKRTNLSKQTDLLSAQIITEDAKRGNLNKQTDLLNAQITLEGIKGNHLNKQVDLLGKQVDSEDAKKDLYRRQIEGFDEDYKQKILKIMMDSWAVGFSVSKDSFQASGIPATMQKTTIDDLYNSYIRTDFD